MSKTFWLLISGLALVLILVLFLMYPKTESADTITRVATPDITGNLEIVDTAEGNGPNAALGKTLTVHYKGTLTDGTVFDSSLDRGEPFTFTLGEGKVIQGWEEGFKDMKVGGKRKLTVPAHLGYGNQSIGKIPANSTLIFEVELLKVE